MYIFNFHFHKEVYELQSNIHDFFWEGVIFLLNIIRQYNPWGVTITTNDSFYATTTKNGNET